MQRFNLSEFKEWCKTREILFVFDTKNQWLEYPPGIRFVFKFPVVKIGESTKRIQFSNTYDVFLIEQVKEVRYYENTHNVGGFIDIICSGNQQEIQQVFRFFTD